MISKVSVTEEEFSEVLGRLEKWPEQDRWTLSQRLLNGLDIKKRPLSRPPMSMSLEEIEGMLATDKPAPDDETCKRWIEEERMRKYG